MSSPDRYALGDFVLDCRQRRVLRVDGSDLELSPRLFDALLLLVMHAGELLDKERLIQALWPGRVVEENNLSQVISALRRALGDGAEGRRYIETVPRRGFRFVAPVTVVPAEAATGSPAALAPAGHVPAPVSAADPAASPRRLWLRWAAGLATVAAGVSAVWAIRRPPEHLAVPSPVGSMAVLPFKPLLDDQRDELLEIGMADSLIAQLSTLPGLAVRSIGVVRRFGPSARDPLQAGRELGVDWVVDGSLQRSGDQLRVTARLLRTADGVAAWSGVFAERYLGVFDIQDQIANKVRDAVLPALQAGSPARQALVEVGGTRSAEAYQHYLAARWRAQGGRVSSIEKALSLLHQALAIDPGYAQAWAELAWVHRRKLWNADALPREVFEASNQALQRALVLVPGWAPARAGMAFTRSWFDFDWTGAETEFRRALDDDPGITAGHWGLAQLLLTQGRVDEGFDHMRRARDLDPMSPVLQTLEASFRIAHGDHDEARRRLERSFDIAPQQWLAHVAQAMLHHARNEPEQGIASLRRAVALAEGSSRPQAMLAAALAADRQLDEARAIRDRLSALSRQRFVSPSSLAVVHTALGETDAALTELERALQVHDTRLVYLRCEPVWRVLWREPRFDALVRALKMQGQAGGLMSV